MTEQEAKSLLGAAVLRIAALTEALRILGWRPGHCFCPEGSRRHTDECIAARRVLGMEFALTPRDSDEATSSPIDSAV